MFCYDVEGTLMEGSIELYLFQQRPFLVFRAILHGLVNGIAEKIRNYNISLLDKIVQYRDQYYRKSMSSAERYVLGKIIAAQQKRERIEAIKSIFNLLERNGYDTCIITSGDSEIIRGFLDALNVKVKEENIFASNGRYISAQEKGKIVRGIKEKGKRVVFVGDSSNDKEALRESNFPFSVKSPVSYVLPIPNKAPLYRLSSLQDFQNLLYNLLEE